MEHPREHTTHRRGFLSQLTAGALALVTTGLGATRLAAGGRAERSVDGEMNDKWLDRIKGKHRQVFDAVSPNGGLPMVFAMSFLDRNHEAYGLSDRDLTAVLSLRHNAMPLALDDAMWEKYKLGDMVGVADPATKAPAMRNIYYHSRAGDIPFPAASIDKLQARGVIVTACNFALTVLSGIRAATAGVSADEAKKEWTAHLLPGVNLVPAGVLAINRAQERGCTYCFAE